MVDTLQQRLGKFRFPYVASPIPWESKEKSPKGYPLSPRSRIRNIKKPTGQDNHHHNHSHHQKAYADEYHWEQKERAEIQLQKMENPLKLSHHPFSNDVTGPHKSMTMGMLPLMAPDEPNYSTEQMHFLTGMHHDPSRPQSVNADVSGNEFLSDLSSSAWAAAAAAASGRTDGGQGGSGGIGKYHQVDDVEMQDRAIRGGGGEGAGGSSTSLPSLHDLREMNAAPFFGTPRTRHGSLMMLSAQDLAAVGATENGGGGGGSHSGYPSYTAVAAAAAAAHDTMLLDIRTFLSTVALTQLEVKGISGVVADYLAWMARSPRFGGSMEGVVADMLSTMETRLREMQEMSDMRNWAAYKDLLMHLQVDGGVPPGPPSRGSHSTGGSSSTSSGSSSESLALKSCFSSMVEELNRRSSDLGHFFKNGYDVSAPLHQQLRLGHPDKGRGEHEHDE